MKLNTRIFRYLSPEDWRVLTAVEIGSKNHLVVPTNLITQLSGLRTGGNGAQKSISTLAKANLIARVRNTRYDGYRLTYGGLDYLALHAHTKSSAIVHLGSQMGVGKESDIYLVTSPTPVDINHPSPSTASAAKISCLTPSTTPATSSAADIQHLAHKPLQSILKIHRLGRISFRSLARNRDYHRHRQHCSWQYLSQLSAKKEYAAMCALYEAGFPVPRPIAYNRHTIVMSLVPGVPLKDVPLYAFANQVAERESPSRETEKLAGAEPEESPEQLFNEDQNDPQSNHESQEKIEALYAACIELSMHLASHGLIHGDLNEFNILIEHVPDPEQTDSTSFSSKGDKVERKPMKPHLIDFPQITSLSHPDAADYFARDIECIKTFFEKRYHFITDEGSGPTFADAKARLEEAVKSGTSKRLDVAIEAAGFSRKMSRDLEGYFAQGRENDGTEDFEIKDGEGDEDEAIGDFADSESDHSETGVSGDLDQKIEERDERDSRITGMETKTVADGASLVAVAASVPIESAQELSESTYSATDPVVAAKLASLSLRPRQPQRPKAKAAAGWAI